MLDILIFEMVFFIAALVSLWQVLFTTQNINEVHLVFAVGAVLAIVIAYLGRKNKRWLWLILLLLTIMPLISQLSLRWSLPVLGLLLWRYLVGVPAPHNELDYADKVLIIIFFLVGLVILRDNTSYFVGQTAGIPVYLPLMILSGIFFLRSLRHHRTGQSHWRIRQANIFYLGLIFVTYLISQSLWLRHQLRRIVGVFYQVVMTPINRVLEAFNQWLFADPEGIMVEELAETSEPPPGLGEAGEEIMQGAEAAFTGSIIGNIVMALFLLLTIYLVYRVFIRRIHFSRPSEQGDDIREQMAVLEPKKRRFRRESMPSQADEQIRYYYRRFLNKMEKEREDSDTSQDLDRKAEQLGLDSHPMSQIYRQVRYGERVADRALVEEMKRLWRELERDRNKPGPSDQSN